MKRLIVVFLVCVFVTPGISQKKLGDENKGLHFDIAFVPAWIPLNGDEMQFGDSVTMFGLTKTFNLGIDLSPGLYVFGNLAAKNGDDPNYKIGVAAYVKLFKGGGFGVGYPIIEEGIGVQAPRKDNLALLFGLKL
jgi:hypothetical protein